MTALLANEQTQKQKTCPANARPDQNADVAGV